MFSGIQEILLIIAVIVALFLLPRVIGPRSKPQTPIVRRPPLRLSGGLRLAIVVSILWPAAWALYYTPWRQNGIRYCIVGLAPVLIAWSLKWVVAGVKRKG